MRFGLHYVDYHDEHRTRYPKRSAEWYRAYIAQHRRSYRGRAVLIPPVMGPPIGEEKGRGGWIEAMWDAALAAAENGLPALLGD